MKIPLRMNWEKRLEDVKAQLKDIEKAMSELESLNRTYPGRYDQRLSREVARYKWYCDKLDQCLSEVDV